MPLTEIILQLSIWIIIVPLVAGCLFFKKLDRPSLIIFTIVVAATIPQLLTLAMHHNKNLNIVYNLYTLVEFMLMYLMLAKDVARSAFRYINYVMIAGFYLLAIIEISKYGLKAWFLNSLVAAASIVYLVWIFVYILECVLNEKTLLDARLPMFWYITGWLLYAPCTSFVFSLANYIDFSKNAFIHNLWSIQGIFNILLYLLFAVGFYQSFLLRKKRANN